jgi:hypothetical protein
MAVIELAKPGQEAITYELIISAGNSAGTLNLIVGTQLLNLFGANACVSGSSCPSNTVDCSDKDTYLAGDGPNKWSTYTYTVLIINILSVVIFTQFLPSQKKQCNIIFNSFKKSFIIITIFLFINFFRS